MYPAGINAATYRIDKIAPFGSFVGRMQYAPTLTAENGASNKHVFAPFGPFVGRMQYAPTRDNEKRKMNNEKAEYVQEESSYAPGIFYVPF